MILFDVFYIFTLYVALYMKNLSLFLVGCFISFFIQGSGNSSSNKSSKQQTDSITCTYRLAHTLQFGANREVMLGRTLETNFEESIFNKKFSCGRLFFILPNCAYSKDELGELSGKLNPYFVLGLLGYQHMLNELNAESSGSVKMQGEILQNLVSSARQEGFAEGYASARRYTLDNMLNDINGLDYNSIFDDQSQGVDDSNENETSPDDDKQKAIEGSTIEEITKNCRKRKRTYGKA